MKRLKYGIGLLAIAITALLAWVFIPTHETLGQQVSEQALNEDFTLVGHRLHSTDPDAGKQFAYFVLADGVEVDGQTPFLITSDPFVRMTLSGEHTLMLTVHGRIYQYHNDLWVTQADGTLHHWYVSANAEYVR